MDLVDQRGQHITLGLVAVLLQHLAELGRQRGVTARMASIRWDRNQTTLLSSWSTVSHATATPSAVSCFAHWAASVLFPKPVGP